MCGKEGDRKIARMDITGLVCKDIETKAGGIMNMCIQKPQLKVDPGKEREGEVNEKN